MKLICTFPGRYGDLLWALPAMRALAARHQQPVDLVIAGEFRSILPLLRGLPYLGRVGAADAWSLHPDQPEPPRGWTQGYDRVYHLHYAGWPQRPLPFHVLDRLNAEALHKGYEGSYLPDDTLMLDRPWLTGIGRHPARWPWLYGFTDVHFELKYGLITLLQGRRRGTAWGGGLPACWIGDNPRWRTEAGESATTWEESASMLRSSGLLLTDCSALHVLAVALGVPVLLMEPLEARWNPIFYPLGMDGPQVTVVKGTDGRPTWDARHVADTLQHMLARQELRR